VTSRTARAILNFADIVAFHADLCEYVRSEPRVDPIQIMESMRKMKAAKAELAVALNQENFDDAPPPRPARAHWEKFQ
jgi:hypothetical protein